MHKLTMLKSHAVSAIDPSASRSSFGRIIVQFVVGFCIGAILVACNAIAQTLPSGIRIMVPFTPSGPVDMSARILAEKLKAQLGIPVVIENRPGANGTIAAMAVKQAPADGSVLLFTSSGMLTISPHLETLPYDVFRDFAPVTTVVYADMGLVVGAKVAANSVKELVESARRSSKEPLAFGSAGTGNVTHGLLELFKDAAMIDVLHVPYKGAGLAITDILGGQLSGMFVAISLALPHVKAGKLKVLGIVGPKRSGLLPNVPTFEELGYSGLDFLTWTGIMVPKNTPPEIIKALGNAVVRALDQEDIKAKLFASGMAAWALQGEEFTQAIKKESGIWKKLIADKNITAK